MNRLHRTEYRGSLYGRYLRSRDIVLFCFREQEEQVSEPRSLTLVFHDLSNQQSLAKSQQQTIFDPEAHTHTPANPC